MKKTSGIATVLAAPVYIVGETGSRGRDSLKAEAQPASGMSGNAARNPFAHRLIG